MTQAVVGSLDEVEGGVHGVARQSGDEEKAVFATREGLHRFTSKRPIGVRPPIISPNGAVVRSTQKGKLLVKTCFVITS